MMKFLFAMTIAAAMAAPVTDAMAEDRLTEEAGIQRLFESGLMARDAGNLPAARSFLEEAVAARPGAARLRFELGLVRAEMGDCRAAAQLFGDAARLAPTPSMHRPATVRWRTFARSGRPLRAASRYA